MTPFCAGRRMVSSARIYPRENQLNHLWERAKPPPNATRVPDPIDLLAATMDPHEIILKSPLRGKPQMPLPPAWHAQVDLIRSPIMKFASKPKGLFRNNVILLSCLLVMILVVPLFETRDSLFRDLLFSGIFFSGIFALEFPPRARVCLLLMASLATLTTWANYCFGTSILYLVDFGTSFITLAVIVALMIRHIARSNHVTPAVILGSVNGYLLLGLLGAVSLSIGNAISLIMNGPDAFGVALPDGEAPEYRDFLYFAFVTLTTVGFGDITAVSPLTRSLVILISLAGPLYMTLLIAMLVGKFLASSGAGQTHHPNASDQPPAGR